MVSLFDSRAGRGGAILGAVNAEVLPCVNVSRSGESPERSEIQMEVTHHNEHPKSPLIADLTRPSSRVVGQ